MRQRSYVHFLRDGLDYLARKVADDCLIELRRLYDRRNAEEARRDLPLGYCVGKKSLPSSACG